MELVMLQVSCDSAAPELEDRARFKRYFQMIPTEASLSKHSSLINMDGINFTQLLLTEMYSLRYALAMC